MQICGNTLVQRNGTHVPRTALKVWTQSHQWLRSLPPSVEPQTQPRARGAALVAFCRPWGPLAQPHSPPKHFPAFFVWHITGTLETRVGILDSPATENIYLEFLEPERG